MWRSYHSVRTSASFCQLWKEFIRKTTQSDPEPTFYQNVTDRMFETMIVEAFPLQQTPCELTTDKTITYDDANVIRYIAGYVCYKVHKQIKELYENRSELLTCLEGLLESEECEEHTASADWMNVIDRGGLVKVKEGTYMLFCAMEEIVCEHYQMGKITKMTDGSREHVETAIMESEDVLFYWCLLTTIVSDSDGALLLERLVKLWITIRGFAFTSAWLELYKQHKRKALQKSKALRKTIQ